MSEEGKIDEIFRRKLDKHSIAPQADVWSNIDSNLDKDGKKGMAFFRWTFLALILIGSIAGAYYGICEWNSEANPVAQLENRNQSNTSTSETQSTQETNPNESQSKNTTAPIKSASELKRTADDSKAHNPIQSKEAVSNESQIKSNDPNANKSQIQSKFVVETGVSNSLSNSSGGTELAENTTDQNDSSSENIEQSVYKGFSTGMNIESESVDTGLDFMEMKSANLKLLSPDLINPQLNLSNPNIEHNSWSMGLYYEANWNDKRVTTKIGGNVALDSLIASESNTFSSGYGINVAYTSKKGLRISTGIEYATWCRSASYPVSIPLIFQAGPELGSGTYNGEIQGPTGDQIISIDYANIPVNENVALSPENFEIEIDIHECYSAIGIPLRVGYELDLGNWNLVPEAGLTYNRIISSEIEGDASYELNSVKLNRENNYSENIFSLTGSISLERHLNETFKIGLVGSYTYWLTPIYATEAFETHPYIFSGRLGIWYTFK